MFELPGRSVGEIWRGVFSPSINRLGLIAADGIKFFVTSIYLSSSVLNVSQDDYRDLLTFGFVYH